MPKKNLRSPYKTDVSPDLAKEVEDISDAMRPVHESGTLEPEPKPFGRPRGSRASRAAYVSMVAKRAVAPRLKKEKAGLLAAQANDQADPERRQNAELTKAEAALRTPFDPAQPILESEHQAVAVAEDPELAAEVVTWQTKLASQTIRSIDTLVFLRDNAYSEQVRLNAAKDILDRAGADSRKSVKATVNIYANASTDDLIRALERLDAIEAQATVPGESLLPAGAA